ncbi:MAG: hypothetical protein JO297_12385, partial [Nitrososphaeraceae archaeon]|nr:hypothetical protein [Nitrososphaeraceae archaeon]
MANWSASIFQILTSFIGSGLILFVVTYLVSDFNQPHINLHVDQSVIADNQITSKIVATNDGRVVATHVLLTAFYPAHNIVSYNSPFHNENMTLIHQEPSVLIAKIDRLAKDATIAINIMATKMNKGLGFNNSYIVSASYDQGSNTISNTRSPADIPTYLPTRIQIVVFASAFSAVFFIIAYYYKRIKNLVRNLGRATYVLSIIREIDSIQNEIKNDITSKRIFTIKNLVRNLGRSTYVLSIIREIASIQNEIKNDITSKDNQSRRQIFSNYEDYNKIDEFYVELKKRDSFLSQKNISSDLIKKWNRCCVWLAVQSLRNIDWVRYLDTGHKKTRLALTILAAILGSFFIFGVSEIFRVYFSFSSIIYDIAAAIIRGIVTFFLTIEIINFHWSYNYEVDPKKNDIVFDIALPKYEITKLFIFAILIMGVSLAYIIRVSHIEPSSNLAYEYFALFWTSDFARMLILIFIVPRFLIKGNVIKIKETVQYDTAIEESNSGKDIHNNNEQQEKQQLQQERQQTYLQQQLPQRYDYSYIYNSEEMSRVKQADDDTGTNNNDYNKNKI